MKFSVWMEGSVGYMQKTEHWLAGEFEADTFEDACRLAFPPRGDGYRLVIEPGERPRFWGCQLYDNEADALKGTP